MTWRRYGDGVLSLVGNALVAQLNFLNHDRNTEMKRTIFGSFFLWVLFIPNCFAVNAMPSCQEGDWIGKIGSYPVVMRFFVRSKSGGEEVFAGKYFYQHNSSQELTLRENQDLNDQWEEVDSRGKVTGSLTLICSTGEPHELTGQWQSPDNSKTLPILLKHQKVGEYKEDYYQLRLGKPQVLKALQLGKRSYFKVSYPVTPSIQSVQLQGNSKGVQKINEILLTQLKAAVSGSLQCKEQDEKWGDDGEKKVLMWERDFVVISESGGGYCGGAHGYFDHEAIVYDLGSGAPEKIDTWFNGKYSWIQDSMEYANDGNVKPIPKLWEAVTKRYLAMRSKLVTGARDKEIETNECLESVVFSSTYTWPTQNGLVFHAIPRAYADSPCDEDVLIPYHLVMPYLSEHGKARVHSIGGSINHDRN